MSEDIPSIPAGRVADAARVLGLTERGVQAMAKRGDLPGAVKHGKSWCFDLAKLQRWVARGGSMPRPSGSPIARDVVYFLRAEISGLIKIGSAVDPHARFKGLRCSNSEPLVVLALCPGYVERERELHAEFAAHRSHGEWFHPAPPLLALIETLRDTYTLPVWTEAA